MDRPSPAAPVSSSTNRWLPLLALAAVLLGLLAVRAPAIAMVLAGMAVTVLVALRVPDAATFAVLFLLYSNLPTISVQFHHVPKAVAGVFPLLLALPLIRDLLVRRQPIVLTPAIPFLLLFLAVLVVGHAFSIEPGTSLSGVITFVLEGLTLYLLVTNTVRSKEVLRGATWALLLAGLLMSAVPVFQQVTHTFDNDYGGLAQVEGIGFSTGPSTEGGGVSRQARLAGPIGEKNRYAQVMLVLIPIGLMRYWGEKQRILKLAALACTGSISLGFVLAFSRGGAVGLFLMVLAMVAMRMIDFRRLVFVGVGCGLLLAALPQYWERLSTVGSVFHLFSDDASAAEEPDGAVKRRITEMMGAVRVFIDHPLFGVGPGMYKAYSEEYSNIDALRKVETGRRAHSLFLEIAAENGALGLLAFLAAVAVTLLSLSQARQVCLERDPELAGLVTGYLLALMNYVTSGVFLHLAYMRYFYIVLAMGAAAAYVGLRAREVEADTELVPAQAT